MPSLAASAIWLLLSIAGACAETLRIGVALQVPGHAAAGSAQAVATALRDGFELGLRHAGQLPGGHTLSLSIMPQGEGSEVAQIDAFVKQAAPQILVTTVPREDALAQFKSYSDAGILVIRPAAGGNDLAGKRCMANVFVTGLQAAQPLDAVAQHVNAVAQKRSVLVYAESQAAAAETLRRKVGDGFFREVDIKDGEQDAAALARRVLLDAPQQIVLIGPVTLGAAIVKAVRAAGATDVAIITTTASDEANLSLFGDAAAGLLAPGVWATGLEGKANVDFVAGFEQSFGYLPTTSAVYAYDAAQLIAAALARLSGPVTPIALRDAMHAAEIQSPRGPMTFSNNNFPIQDFYIKRIEAGPQGSFRSVPVSKVFGQFGDDFAAECPQR